MCQFDVTIVFFFHLTGVLSIINKVRVKELMGTNFTSIRTFYFYLIDICKSF